MAKTLTGEMGKPFAQARAEVLGVGARVKAVAEVGSGADSLSLPRHRHALCSLASYTKRHPITW